MPFWLPLLTVDEQIDKYRVVIEIKYHRCYVVILYSLLCCYFIQWQYYTQALLLNPLQRGSLCLLRLIHRSHDIGGANSSTMVLLFVDCFDGGDGSFPTIPTIEIPRGRILLPQVHLLAKLLRQSFNGKLCAYLTLYQQLVWCNSEWLIM